MSKDYPPPRTSLRQHVAAAAARIMAEEGVDDYAQAKRKAAKRLGATDSQSLPGNEEIEAALRSYELLLLREVGLLPQLDVQTLTLGALEPDQPYTLVPEGGLRQAHGDDRFFLTGTQWSALQASLTEDSRFTETLRTCAPLSAALKPMLRTLLHYHCGVRSLRTRQMMVDIQSY